MDVYKPEACEPVQWIVIFHPTTESRFVRFICIGRFKHVSALAYLHQLKCWITYDVGFFGTRVTAVPDTQAHLLAPWVDGCTLVAMRKNPEGHRFPPILGWCVPSIRRLIGLRSSALRPDTLYRHCLRDGGQVINDRPIVESPATNSS